jgi:hypothetical protein
MQLVETYKDLNSIQTCKLKHGLYMMPHNNAMDIVVSFKLQKSEAKV